MAVINDPRLYSGGSAVISTQPVVNMAAQLQAKRQAQEQAKNDTFDEYIRGLNTKINSAGKRIADMPAFEDMYKKWVQYGIENKDKILKNDLPTKIAFDSQYQNLLNLTNESKSAEEEKKPFVEMLIDPAKRSKLSSNVFGAVQSHDLPLYVKNEKGEYVRNPERKRIDYTSNLFDPQFDMAKGFEGWSKGMTKGEKVGEVLRRDPITGRAIVATTKEFTPEQIKQVSINAARSVKDNNEYGNYYQQRYEHLKDDEYKVLNEAYQSVYGKEIKLPNGNKMPNYIDSPEEVAAADAILQAQALTEKGEKPASDWDAKQQASINKIYLNDSLIRGRKTSVADTGADFGNYDILGKYSGNIVTKTVKEKVGGNRMFPKYEEKQVNVVPANQVDKAHKEMIGVSPIPGKNGDQPYYIVKESGDWEGANGQTISAIVIAQKELDKVSLNELRRGRQSLGRSGQSQNNPQPSKPSGKTPKYQGLDANGNPIFK